MIACDEATSVMDIASTKKTNTIATNASISCMSCYNEKVRYNIDCYILHAVLLAIILLLIIIVCYYYTKRKKPLIH